MLAGAASILSLAPVFAWPIMFVTLPVFFLLIDGAIARAGAGGPKVEAIKAASIGWSFGFGYFFASLFWIGEAFLVEAEKFAWALPFAISLLPAGLAVYFAIATAVAGIFWRPGIIRLLALALTLTVTEWLRGQLFTGFPWNILGYTLTGNEGLMQLASIFGAYGLTPLAILIYASPVLIVDSPRRDERSRNRVSRQFLYPLIAITLLFLAMALGYMRLATPPMAPVEQVRLRLVQPNIPQKDKWRLDKRRQVFNRLLEVTKGTSSADDPGLSGVTHVIWPESAFPFLILRSPEALKAISELLPEKTTLLTGALRMDDGSASASASASTNGGNDEGNAKVKRKTERKFFNSLLPSRVFRNSE